MKLRNKLVLEELSCQLLYSYNYIENTFEDWEKRKAFVNWRLEILDYIEESTPSELIFILEYLKREDEKIYLEFLSLVDNYKNECVQEDIKVTTFQSIINYIKQLVKPKSNENINLGKKEKLNG